MAIPVIQTSTSVLEFDQYEYWEFRPVAIGPATSWSIDPAAPTGMEFDASLGMISGSGLRQGIYQIALRALNADGESLPLVLTVGIRSAPERRRTWAVDVDIDIVSRRAVVSGSTTAGGTVTVDNVARTYAHGVKYRDDLLYHVRFFKGATRLDLDLAELAWSLKASAEEPVLAAGNTWRKIGSGADAVYALHVALDDQQLVAAVQDADQAGPEAFFVGMGEFEWLQNNNDFDAVGPEVVRGSSHGMPVLVFGDQNQIPAP